MHVRMHMSANNDRANRQHSIRNASDSSMSLLRHSSRNSALDGSRTGWDGGTVSNSNFRDNTISYTADVTVVQVFELLGREVRGGGKCAGGAFVAAGAEARQDVQPAV